MTSEFDLLPPNPLDLELRGSVGKFKLSAISGAEASPEVVYLQTHVGFDRAAAGSDKLLRHLVPVREVFEFSKLSFGEIMQRDIDDARVSTEMIPYLLESGIGGAVKFFPPIIAVALPAHDGLPEPLYPPVSQEDAPTQRDNQKVRRLRCGDLGAEVFQFEYPVLDGREMLFDQARLRLNSDRVRLVIIDGQHRAMALLALHRNLNDDWGNERRAPFKSYYGEWTKERIRQRDLSALQLPVVICTFPDLCANRVPSVGGMDVVRACRSLFLTLNKSARKVSNSRNILLDDRDLISHFLRGTLEEVKGRNLHSTESLRIWDVELDQYRDRVRLDTAVACTGISHIYYIIEHLMFAQSDVRGVGARSGKFHKRQLVEEGLLKRLSGKHLLGATAAQALGRHSYSESDAERLYKEAFSKRYGKYLLRVLDEFAPFRCHNLATIDLQKRVAGHADRQVPAVLFEGQGIERTFHEYLEHLTNKERRDREAGRQLPPELSALIRELKGTEGAVEEKRGELFLERTARFVESVSDKAKLRRDGDEDYSPVAEHLNRVYSEVFFTVAFQAALVCGFFQVYEIAEMKAEAARETIPDREAEFDTYLSELNRTFAPTTSRRLRDLIGVLSHPLEGERADRWTQANDESSFRRVVARSEMKPDEWPKYRYLLLEIWRPASPHMVSAHEEELGQCRTQVFQTLDKRNLDEKCRELRKTPETLTAEERESVQNRTFGAIESFLSFLNVPKQARWTLAEYCDRSSARTEIDVEGDAAVD